MGSGDRPGESRPREAGENQPPEKNGAGRKSFAQLFPQLFLFPLLLVAVGVLGYVFFRASAEDDRSVEELISDIESGGNHARKQDMYALAVKVRDLAAKDGKPAYFSDLVTAKLLQLLERVTEKDDEKLREYLIAAVGRAGNPELTVPLLAAIATGPTSSLEDRVYAVEGLALSRSPRAIEALERVIDSNDQPEGWDLRWVALAALANIGHDSVVPYLRKAVADPRREVSWSASCWLASFFGDAAGIEVLRKLTDWSYLDGERGERERELAPQEKEQYMVMAIEGLWKLEKDDAAQLIREKSRDTRSTKVRNAALEITSKLERRGSESAVPDGAR